MGTFAITVNVIGQGEYAEKVEPVSLLVDTGATHTVLPKDLLEYLGVQPAWPVELIYANGGAESRWVGYAIIGIGDNERLCPVVFGAEEQSKTDTNGLLGATTLEIFGMGVDPINRKLFPVAQQVRPI